MRRHLLLKRNPCRSPSFLAFSRDVRLFSQMLLKGFKMPGQEGLAGGKMGEGAGVVDSGSEESLSGPDWHVYSI